MAKKQTPQGAEKDVSDATAQPHDLFFKDTVTAIPGCLLAIMKLALSRVEYNWLEWSKVKFKKEIFRDAFGREVRADVVCEVPIKPHIQRRLAPLLSKKIKNFRFIFLIEHKAQNAMLVCKQLAKMLLPLSGDDDCLVLPIVVYHGRRPWTAPRSLHALLKKTNPLFKDAAFRKAFAKNVPNFEYRLVDLNKISERSLSARGLTYGVFPYTLKTIWVLATDTQRVLGRVLRKAEKLPAEGHDAFLQKALQYFFGKYPDLITMEVVVKTAVKARANKTAQKARTLADYVAQRRFESGIEKGRQKGRLEGRQDVVINLLDHMTPEQVAKATKLSLSEVLASRKNKSDT